MPYSQKGATFEMNATRFIIAGSSPAAPAQTGDQPGSGQQQTPPAGDPPAATPPAGQQQTADSEVEKAYTKLREAEDGRKKAENELKKIKTEQLPEAERVKQENEELKTRNATLESDLTKWAAERVASSKGFIDPEAAVAVLLSRGTDLSDKTKAEKALDEYAKEKQGLTGPTPPPSGGPINPSTGSTPAGDQGMNSLIRRQAGRE